MEMIEISQMDIFNLLDHNQDGQLQLKEVECGTDWERFAGDSLAHPSSDVLLVTHVLGWGQITICIILCLKICAGLQNGSFWGNVQQLSCYWETATVLGRTCFEYAG